MSRLVIPTVDTVPDASKPLLDAVQQQLGAVPNMFRLMATSPAALEGFLGLFGASAGRSMSRRATASPLPSRR